MPTLLKTTFTHKKFRKIKKDFFLDNLTDQCKIVQNNAGNEDTNKKSTVKCESFFLNLQKFFHRLYNESWYLVWFRWKYIFVVSSCNLSLHNFCRNSSYKNINLKTIFGFFQVMMNADKCIWFLLNKDEYT